MPRVRQLLVEVFILEAKDFVLETRRDETTGDSISVFSCPFSAADVRNANGRTYTRKLWQKLLDPSGKVQEAIGQRGLYGFLGHPKDGVGDEGEVTHYVTGLELQEDNVVWGRGEILDTPRGKVVQEYRKKKLRIGISTRGLGSYGPDGVVDEDYELIGVDIVLNPSSPGAFIPQLATKRESAETEDSYDSEEKQIDSAAKESVPNNAAMAGVTEKKAEAKTALPSPEAEQAEDKEAKMSGLDQFRLLEAEAKPLLRAKRGEFSKAHEIASAMKSLLDLSGKVGELDDAVKVQRDRLLNRIVEKRGQMEEWADALDEPKSEDKTPAPGKTGEPTVTEEEKLRKDLAEAQAKITEVEGRAAAAKQLCEALHAKNEELRGSLKEAEETVAALDSTCGAAIEVLAALTSVYRSDQHQTAVESVVQKNPALGEFKSLLENCPPEKLAEETVKLLRAVSASRSTKRAEAYLPPKGAAVSSPPDAGESTPAPIPLDEATTEGKGLRILEEMRTLQAAGKKAITDRRPTLGVVTD